MDFFPHLSTAVMLAASLAVVRCALLGSADLRPAPARGLRRPRMDSRGRM